MGYSFTQSVRVDNWLYADHRLSASQPSFCVFPGHMIVLRHIWVWNETMWLTSTVC